MGRENVCDDPSGPVDLQFLCPVTTAGLPAAIHAKGIQCAADYLIANARKVADPASTYEDDGVFLKTMAFARYVDSHFLAVG